VTFYEIIILEDYVHTTALRNDPLGSRKEDWVKRGWAGDTQVGSGYGAKYSSAVCGKTQF
jgi:hypothetical protein